MGSMWRRAIEYLGLAPDDEYDDVEAYEDRRDRQAPASRGSPRSAQPSRTVVPRPSRPSASVDRWCDR